MQKKEYHTLKTAPVDEIIHMLTTRTQPLTKDESKEVLRILVGRSRFDYRLPSALKSCGCDMNVSLDSGQMRCGDYLAYYGRLSPRLISEMNKAGYDFTKTNSEGRHVGYYLHAYSTVSEQVIGALKFVGVDFNHQDSHGMTVVVRYADDVVRHGHELMLHRFCGLCSTQRDFETFCSKDKYHAGEFLADIMDAIPAKCDERIGIEEIYKDNSCKYSLALGMRQHLHEVKAKQVISEEQTHQTLQQRKRIVMLSHGIPAAVVEKCVQDKQNKKV